MNIEMNNKNPKDRSKDHLKEAKENRQIGDGHVKTSCITCKFKPNCDDAIPYYKKSAEIYHGHSAYEDELYCRNKLVFCFHLTKSYWEEGKEHDRIANIYLSNLDQKEKAFSSIQNSYNSCFMSGDYKDAINNIKNLGIIFAEKDEDDYAERCLKITYNAFLETFHTLATKKDYPYGFFYDALDKYIELLFKNNKVRIAIESLENVLKCIEPFEENKDRVIHVYLFLLLSLIVNEDNENLFKDKVDQGKNLCTKNSHTRQIENMDNIYENIKECQESSFRDNMIDVNIEFPTEVTKKLTSLFNDRKQKMRKVSSNNNSHIIVVDDHNEESGGYL